MRRFFGKLANVIRQTGKARPARGDRRRAALQVEALESRQMLSVSPVAALSAAPLNVPPLTPIQFKYRSLGGASGFLGKAVTGELNTPFGGGKYEQFQHGNIYWSASTGAHVVYGPILSDYLQTATEHDTNGSSAQKDLGLPTIDVSYVYGVPGPEVVVFQGGAIYWSATTGAHDIYGANWTEYQATQSESDNDGDAVFVAMGFPTSDQKTVPGVAGASMNTFAGGAAIYWSPASGAHVVYGPIAAKYNSVGGPVGYGLPISDEVRTAEVVIGVPQIFVSHFQGGRAIYWSQATGAHTVYGAIEVEYLATAGKTDFHGQNVQTLLGVPTSDEMNVPGVPGARMNTFQGGNIYWSAATGAHAVYGGILAKYESFGGPASWLGLPVGDEFSLSATERISYFQHGWIDWNPVTGVGWA